MLATTRNLILMRRFPQSLFAGGVQGAWYDFSDLSTLFQDSAGTTPVTANNDPVGRVLDKSGRGNHLTQATAGSRPLYKTDGTRHWLEGDGVDDWLQAQFTITQPWDRISAIQQISWTLNDRIFSGGTANSGTIYQNPATPTLSMFSGAVAAAGSGATIGTDVVLTERHNGASSRNAINNTAYLTVNAGTTACGGVTLFAANSGLTPGNARCYGLIMREGLMTDEQTTAARAYLAAKL